MDYHLRYKGWPEFILSVLTQHNQFVRRAIEHKGTTRFESYDQLIQDKETNIQVGYSTDDRLIYLNITNPKIPGYNSRQIDYLYENDFSISKMYGTVGLTFSTENVNGILTILKTSFNGIERKYFYDDKLIFSKVEQRFSVPGISSYKFTHYIEKGNLISRLVRNLLRKKESYKIIEINLNDIYDGLQ